MYRHLQFGCNLAVWYVCMCPPPSGSAALQCRHLLTSERLCLQHCCHANAFTARSVVYIVTPVMVERHSVASTGVLPLGSWVQIPAGMYVYVRGQYEVICYRCLYWRSIIYRMEMYGDVSVCHSADCMEMYQCATVQTVWRCISVPQCRLYGDVSVCHNADCI